MIKECGICGKPFETSKSNRKYCDDCSPNSTTLKKQYERGLRESKKRMYEPHIITITCDQCGKETKTLPKLLFKTIDHPGTEYEEKHVFCSRKCLLKWEYDHAVCLECGKPLNGNRNCSDSEEFCSDTCKARYDAKLKEYQRQEAKRNGWIRNCEYCGNEFIRKEGTFCCVECYRNAVKEGWRPPAPVPSERRLERIETCPVCGKRQTMIYPNEIPDSLPVRFCSDRCRDIYTDYQRKAGRKIEAGINTGNNGAGINTRNNKKGKIRCRAEARGNTSSTLKQATPLCASCRTSYKDCERMRSGFKELPEGAYADMQGIIIKCPKYKN